MAADSTIRSRENPLLKRLGAVLAGKEPGTLALEGDRLVDDALAAGLVLDLVLVSDAREERARELEARTQVRRVDERLLARASRLTTPPGIVALCAAPARVHVRELALDRTSLLLVVAGVSDPGNLGALARSAEAFGAQALLVARGGAQPWNDKALRGSMGSLLRLPVASDLDPAELVRELDERGVRQAVAATRGGADPARFDWTGPVALWVGAETGERPDALDALERRGALAQLTIPMRPGVESLNVAVATSLLLYCAGRAHGAAGA
jgi:TrmH family RNA methyltransferase